MRSLSLSARACVLVFVGTRPLLWSQGVVAFLQGDSGKASGLLIRASAEAKSLKPNPALAARLMQQWHAVKFEVLRPKVRSIVQLEQLYFYVVIEETGGAGMLMWLAKSGVLSTVEGHVGCGKQAYRGASAGAVSSTTFFAFSRTTLVSRK